MHFFGEGRKEETKTSTLGSNNGSSPLQAKNQENINNNINNNTRPATNNQQQRSFHNIQQPWQSPEQNNKITENHTGSDANTVPNKMYGSMNWSVMQTLMVCIHSIPSNMRSSQHCQFRERRLLPRQSIPKLFILIFHVSTLPQPVKQCE